MTETKATVSAAGLPNGILILGAAKSGTTALFYAIRNGLAERLQQPVEGMFEPTDPHAIVKYLDNRRDAVALVKVLLGPILRRDQTFISRFDRRIVIYRDPRDNVVSRLVYMLTRIVDARDHAKVERVVQLFREKEENPDSISVMKILSELSALSGREELAANVRANALLPAQVKREAGDTYFMMPYDDLVTYRFANLSEYVGFDIPINSEVDEKHAYVVRTKSSGDWKNWFLDEDVQYFSRDVAADLRLLGFDPDQLPELRRTIEPKASSEYVAAQFQRIISKRRERREAKRAI